MYKHFEKVIKEKKFTNKQITNRMQDLSFTTTEHKIIKMFDLNYKVRYKN